MHTSGPVFPKVKRRTKIGHGIGGSCIIEKITGSFLTRVHIKLLQVV
jgi:hypothetical protein